MASTKTSNAKGTTTCKPRTCPTCGTQECFERPRFFCGQLLTDKDLDAAQRYVIEKNRLHNRYLVGTGVVCGMAVRCDPCDGIVTIEPGYAIDCCGNDIVVCEAQKFDVLDYLKSCFKREEDGCQGKIQPPPSRCDREPKEYCLVISYDELHTRPMTAMMRDNGCRTSRCEPSRTSEVFRFDLVEKGDAGDEAANDFWTRARACLEDFLKWSRKFFDDFKQATGTGGQQARHNALFGLFCRMKSEVLQVYRKGPQVRCAIREQLAELEDDFPTSPNNPQYDALVYNAIFRLFGWRLQLAIDCLCDALLVPCTECSEDDEGVLLACLTVRDDRIEKICNIARKQVLTGPALRYWLQPLFRGVGGLIEHLCCGLNLGATFDRMFRPEPAQTTTTVTGLGMTRSPGAGGQDANALGEEASTAEGVESAMGRGEAALGMVGDYSAATLSSLRAANLLQLTDPQTLTALDLYGLSASAARSRLKELSINASERHAGSEGEAYALSNLFGMAWVLTPQSSVELVIDTNDRVAAVRFQEATGK